MDLALAVVCLIAGLLVGAVLGVVGAGRHRSRTRRTRRARREARHDQLSSLTEGPAPLGQGVADVVAVLRSSVMVVDESDVVVAASPSASALGLVRSGEIVHPELRKMVRQVRRDGVVRESELALARGPMGQGVLDVAARTARLDRHHVLLFVDDRTQAKRVEEVRRDFVANVSHELKTPVGGIALLAEAVLDANEDPEAVARFARRIAIESSRLTQLVQEIVDLSRLQASESLSDPVLVDLREVVEESVELTSTLAQGRHITCAVGIEGRPVVYGDGPLLRTAVSNLLTNAVNYSADHTRVAVGVREVDEDGDRVVEISVTDQGVGIPAAEQDRIFERFYRVDAARSRATGGTGLGLAIVKHICTNHGGEVRLWSSPGDGSTFTIRLPAAAHEPEALPVGDAAPTREVTR